MTATETIAWTGVPRLPLIGTVLTLPGAVIAELIAEPFDVVWIDLEHGALDRAQAQEMILGAQAAGTLALTRLAQSDAGGLVGAMLDAGADGVVIADVRTAVQAEWLATLLQYPPTGLRGYGPRRSTLRGRTRHEDRDPARLWLQIESQGRRRLRGGDRAGSGTGGAGRRDRRPVHRPRNPDRPGRSAAARRA